MSGRRIVKYIYDIECPSCGKIYGYEEYSKKQKWKRNPIKRKCCVCRMPARKREKYLRDLEEQRRKDQKAAEESECIRLGVIWDAILEEL